MNNLDVNWSSYAEVYDFMTKHNPAYQEIVAAFLDEMENWSIAPNSTLIDLGAGTGNFSLLLSAKFNENKIIHIDSDRVMNRTAQIKADEKLLTNIEITTKDIKDVEFKSKSISAIVCVHALYTFAAPKMIIQKMYDWLTDDGFLFVCDLGRVIDVVDWSKYLFKELYKKYGLIQTLEIFIKGRDVANQNRKIAKAQRNGKYWTHNNEQIKNEFEKVGFNTINTSEIYRNYSDLIIRKKRASYS